MLSTKPAIFSEQRLSQILISANRRIYVRCRKINAPIPLIVGLLGNLYNAAMILHTITLEIVIGQVNALLQLFIWIITG